MRFALLFTIIVMALAGCSGGGEPSAPSEQGEQGELNLDLWLERLEVGSRELYSARNAVVSAVPLKDGDWVADIGAGTGL